MKKLEMGDNLEKLAERARNWFKDSNKEVPITAISWRSKSVRKLEIPPGMSYATLAKLGIKVSVLIQKISKDSNIIIYTRNPFTKDNLESRLGLRWLGSHKETGHKKVQVSCTKCQFSEILDYGTFGRMEKAGNKLCRVCRLAGGKRKPISTYNKFEGFEAIKYENKRILFKCLSCTNGISRTLTTVLTAEYIVCEHCYPNVILGTNIDTEYGKFDSYIEYKAYLVLLKYFSLEDIDRQASYNTLFNTGTKHTADFFIKSINLVIEVTTKTNKIHSKYKETMEWKQSLSNSVKFCFSLKEVEDIVRPFAKA